MTRSLKAIILSSALAAIPSVSVQAAEAANRPNIVVILADDLGYGDLGCYNPESKIPTPRLDRLAAQGIRLTDAHAPTACCTPTRYGLLTGRYCWRTRLKKGVLQAWEPPLIEAGRATLPGFLRANGYATACVGKWHLGWTWPTKDGRPPESGADRLSNVDFSRPVADGPITRGFDRYFGVDLPNYPPYCFIDGDRTVGIPSAPSAPPIQQPGPMLPGWKWVDILPELTRRAEGVIEEAARAKPARPFFLYFPLTAPHFPVVPDPEFRGAGAAGEFGDFVAQVDHTVGRVLDALGRTGLDRETLVIFTSDNGPEIAAEGQPGAYARAERFDHYSMGPLRGAKRDAWEGGHRVPFLARWPGHVPERATSGEIACLTDLIATCAAILGVDLPAGAGEDSQDILPTLLGGKIDRKVDVFHGSQAKFLVRRGDWVLIDAPTGQENGGDRGEPAWYKQKRGYSDHDQPGELYNLRDDPAQRHNLYAQHPDLVKNLKEVLERIKGGDE